MEQGLVPKKQGYRRLISQELIVEHGEGGKRQHITVMEQSLTNGSITKMTIEAVLPTLDDDMLAELMAAAKAVAPEVMCGLIGINGKVKPITNTALDPFHGFDMELCVDATELPLITAVYHSHPDGSPWLTVDDIEGICEMYDHGISWDYLVATRHSVIQYELCML